jgi:hypothetical protein
MRRDVLHGSRRQRKKAMQSRAWLNGVEVTTDCQFADDRAGRVLLLLRNANGRHYAGDGHEVARAWRRGRVRIGRRSAVK